MSIFFQRRLATCVALICTAVFSFSTTLFAWQMQQAPLMTRWAALVDTNNPLPEYPRPQLVRTNWLSLNGLWEFQAGATNDPVPVNQTLSGQILVPFPMESAISGVMHYSPFSWYRRTFTIPAGWNGKSIILHLDAVNWETTIYVNGTQIGVHRGGYDPFSYDITSALHAGANELILRVYSPEDSAGEPRGKQTLYPGGIMYTSSSGIWQPAWLEPVDAAGVSDLRIVPDVDNARVRLTVSTYSTAGVTISASVLSNGVVVSSGTGAPGSEIDLAVTNANLWSPENPFLYDLRVSAIKGAATNDSVLSYFGMRKFSLKTVNGVPQIYLNNQPYFYMGPLDQGFWPDGIYTAPTDEALKYDIEMEKALGFNMVRKHIKVERQRWYYWADKLGIVVWQDMPSCNSYTGNPQPVDANQFINELTNMVVTHWNSPAIAMWTLFNEGQGQSSTGQTNTPYLASLVKNLDPYRLVNQASGNDYHNAGDVLDNHSYPPPGNPTSATQAPVDGEYGGIGFQMAGHLWNPALAGGNYVGANTTNDLASIYDSFSTDLMYYKSSGGLNGAVYTQITDVENECNGLLTYDRVLKPSLEKIQTSNRKAITGRVSLSGILPTSQNAPRIWNYTTSAPASDWYATNFDDSLWSSGPGGFGTSMTPSAVVGTTWNTSDIWLRQRFRVGDLSPMDRANLMFVLYHDEDCEIYINGVLAASASGYITSYQALAMNAAGQAALVANATNVIAVHCHQTGGGQDIDVGIAVQHLLADLFVVPTDAVAHWKLDEASGTIASDASGNGDAGTVSGATWDNNGKIGGCLDFNGVSSYVRVANPGSNDFSISFWVKTSQTAGVGQWYNGRCLVDGFTAVDANDFGTALSGSDFAFGTGHPDTTITSPAAINDGAWHQCVATREQAAGALKVYVDGTLAAFGTGGTNLLNAAGNLRFGSRQTGANYFSGSLDDIQFFNRALGSNEIAALFFDGAAQVAAPTNVAAIASNRRVTLDWSSVFAASSYDVLRSFAADGPFVSIGNVTDTTFNDDAVTNGLTYYYTVAGMNALGDGTNSAVVSATPALAASLVTWFKADALSGMPNGAPVSDWPDSSGNGNDAVAINSFGTPTYQSNALHGLPVVHFDSASSNALAFPRSVDDDFTILCLFRSAQGYGNGNVFFQGAGLVNGEVAGMTSDFGSCLFADGSICAGSGNPDVAANSDSGFNDGNPHLMTFKRVKSTGSVELYVDGLLASTVYGSTVSLLAPARLVLGAQQTMINFLTGDIAEVKIFNSALGDGDRLSQENRLIYKWGIRALPALVLGGIDFNAHALTIGWPASAQGWALYAATNLAPETLWQQVTNVPASNNGQSSVTLPITSGTQFFRLVAL